MQLMPRQRHLSCHHAASTFESWGSSVSEKFQDVPGQIRRTKDAIRRSGFLQIEIDFSVREIGLSYC